MLILIKDGLVTQIPRHICRFESYLGTKFKGSVGTLFKAIVDLIKDKFQACLITELALLKS